MAPRGSTIIGGRAAAHCRGEGGSSPTDLEIGDESVSSWWRHFADAFNASTFRKLHLVHPCGVVGAALVGR